MRSGRADCLGQGERKEKLTMVRGRINMQGSNEAQERPSLKSGLEEYETQQRGTRETIFKIRTGRI
jgi:hypothetical protein